MKKLFNQWISVIVILTFILGSTIFLYYFSIDVDTKYSNLIQQQTTISTDIKSISNKFNEDIYVLLDILYIPETTVAHKLRQNWELTTTKNLEQLDKLSKKAFLAEQDKAPLIDLLATQKEYIGLCRHVFDLKDKGENDSILFYFRQKIAPLSRIIQKDLQIFLDANNTKLLEISNELTLRNKNKGLLYLTIGVTPFVLLLLYLTFISLLLAFFTFFIYKNKKKDIPL